MNNGLIYSEGIIRINILDTDKKSSFYDRYGSRRGFMRLYWFRSLYSLGFYRKYRNVKWENVERLVFVCKGNICRSAYAEAVANSYNLESVSCGIHTTLGKPANILAQEAALRAGRDIRKHKTTPLSSVSLRKGDLLVAMEPWQLQYLENKFGMSISSILLGLWSPAGLPFDRRSIPDRNSGVKTFLLRYLFET